MNKRLFPVPPAYLLVAGLAIGCASSSPRTAREPVPNGGTTLRTLTPDEFERATLADIQKDPESSPTPKRARDSGHVRPGQNDYSGPPRLTPEEFERATAADKSEEEEDDAPPAPRAPRPPATRRRHQDSLTIIAAPAPFAAAAPQKFQITLRNDFIEKYKNRVTLSTPFQIMGASAVHSIGSGGDDGDVHCGGIASEVGLPCVAEVMNASGNPVAARMKNLAKTHEEVQVTGAWRLWDEHPGVPQIQDDTDYVGPASNPNHVFELHPVTRFDGQNVTNTIHAISGYTAYDAVTGFRYYESVTCTIIPNPQEQTTTLMTPQAKYNYVEFRFRAEEDAAFQTIGGRMLRASVLDDQGQVIVRNRRMVFINGTDSEEAAKTMKKDDELHVLGIPRVDLALVSWRARNAHNQPDALTWNLPYEIIVVGVYADH